MAAGTATRDEAVVLLHVRKEEDDADAASTRRGLAGSKAVLGWRSSRALAGEIFAGSHGRATAQAAAALRPAQGPVNQARLGSVGFFSLLNR